jgi:hypothetical protein
MLPEAGSVVEGAEDHSSIEEDAESIGSSNTEGTVGDNNVFSDGSLEQNASVADDGSSVATEDNDHRDAVCFDTILGDPQDTDSNDEDGEKEGDDTAPEPTLGEGGLLEGEASPFLALQTRISQEEESHRSKPHPSEEALIVMLRKNRLPQKLYKEIMEWAKNRVLIWV